MKKLIFITVFIFINYFCIPNIWASGAGFKILGQNIEIIKVNEKYKTNVLVGQSLILIAQGWVYPKSRDPDIAKGGPFKADAGTWLFDDKIFRKILPKFIVKK